MVEGRLLLKAPLRNYEGSPDRLPPALTQTRAFQVHSTGTLRGHSARLSDRCCRASDTVFAEDFTHDGPDETRQFAGDGGTGLHFHFAPHQVLLIAAAKTLLRFPGDGLHDLGGFLGLALEMSALAGRESVRPI